MLSLLVTLLATLLVAYACDYDYECSTCNFCVNTECVAVSSSLTNAVYDVDIPARKLVVCMPNDAHTDAQISCTADDVCKQANEFAICDFRNAVNGVGSCIIP